MAPTAPSPGNTPAPADGPASLGRVVELAARERGQATATTPLQDGLVCPRALCRYAAGAIAPGERRDLEGTLQRLPATLGLVGALVRGARQGGSPLANRLLAAARLGEGINPYRVIAATLLDGAGRAAEASHVAAGRTAGGDDPLSRAADHLARGERTEAAAALGDASAESEWLEAARDVASREDPDEALIALLSAVSAPRS